MTRFDLLVKNGRVIDPAQGLNARADVAIAQGRIVAVGADLAASQAVQVIDASDRIVCPGLLDLHAHVAESIVAFGLAPNDVGVFAGVTTVCDAGSTGYANFPGFRRFVIESSDTDIFCFLHLSPVGEVILPEIGYESFNRAAFVQTVQANRDLIRGIKIRVIAEVVANSGFDVVAVARDLAAELDLPVMVHIGTAANQTVSPEMIAAYTRAMLNQLRAGDIVTHCYTFKPGWIFDRAGQPLPEAQAALARGVRLDVGSAHGHLDFAIARAAMARGFIPYTLSTDLTTLTFNQALPLSLTHLMSEFLALGLTLDQVIEMTTSHPAAILQEPSRGSLRQGVLANLTLLEIHSGSFRFFDGKAGNTISGAVLLTADSVIKGDRVFECNRRQAYP